MARSARAVRTRAPHVGVIVLIIVCLALAGGYVPLWMQFAKRGQSLDQLHADVKANLEDRLGALGVHASVRASKSDVAYDSAFFRKVGDAALVGIKFPELVELTGYQGQDPIGQIKEELAATAPPQDSLRAYILKLKDDLVLAREQLDQANGALRAAQSARDEALSLLEQKGQQLDKERIEAEKKLREARDRYNAEIAQMKQLMNQASLNEKKAWQQLAAAEDRHKAELAELQDQVSKLQARLAELQAEMERRFPRRETAMKGRILQANLLEGVAIINLGARENVKVGDRFDVVRIGKGGERIKKAQIQVIHVDPLVSRADILSQDLEDPIAREDLVLRTEETGETEPGT